MSTTPSTLPEGWEEFLDDASQRLESLLAQVEGRIAQTPAGGVARLDEERRQDTARLETSLLGLGARLESAQRLADEVDVALQAGEDLLRHQATACAGVRQRLAEWAGRAIG